MAYEQHVSAVFLKSTLKFFLCIHIQVVGGLVKDQEVGFLVNKLAKPYLGLLASASTTILLSICLVVRPHFARAERTSY